MNESPDKHEVIAGLFVFIGLIFLLGGTLMVGNLHETFNNKIGMFSHFDDANGLQKGNNVWYSGVKIGTVSSLSFYGKSQVEVKIDIQTKARKYIRKNAKVKISSDGFIGNKICDGCS
jgi:phospholipid/cholesterol/gamma-HCH transport system substrate-binding protein